MLGRRRSGEGPSKAGAGVHLVEREGRAVRHDGHLVDKRLHVLRLLLSREPDHKAREEGGRLSAQCSGPRAKLSV